MCCFAQPTNQTNKRTHVRNNTVRILTIIIIRQVKAGLEAIQAAEEKKAKQLAKLKARSEDDSLGVVKKGKAFQEFKKLEGEDPLPLREAKIKQVGSRYRPYLRSAACWFSE